MIRTLLIGLVGILGGRLVWAFIDELGQLEQRTRSFARGVST